MPLNQAIVAKSRKPAIHCLPWRKVVGQQPPTDVEYAENDGKATKAFQEKGVVGLRKKRAVTIG